MLGIRNPFEDDHQRLTHNPEFETFKAADVGVIPQERDADEDMGTTILASTFKDGVILACDGRTAAGVVIAHYASPKITKLTDHICVCRSGNAAASQMVAQIVAKYLKQLEIQMGCPPPVETAARLFQQVCYYNPGLGVGLIVAGWDPIHGGQVFSIPMGGSKSKVDYSMGGSGSTFLYGWADNTWKKDMAEKECKEWLETAVSHAKARDSHSGGNTRTTTITKDGLVEDMQTWTDTKYKLETDPTFNKQQDTAEPFPATVKAMY